MPLDLTTVERVKARLAIATATTANDAEIRSLISSTSAAVERYLGRHVRAVARTEDYSLARGQRIVLLRGYPVTTLTSIKIDSARQFTCDPLDSTTYHADTERGILTFDNLALAWGAGILRVAYTGGMGASAARLNGVPGAVAGVMTAGNAVSGGTSGARGVLREVTASTSIAIDVESGVFIAGETVTDLTAAGSTPLASISQEPIIHAYPDVVEAVEQEIKRRWAYKDSLAVLNVSAEGGSVSLDEGRNGLLSISEYALARHRRMTRSV